MQILDTILNAQNGGMVRQVARQFGINENQANAAIRTLLPALTTGIRQNVSQPGGLESLLGALGSGNHERYLEDDSLVSRDETVREGNGILGHILGSKDVSRQVASRASEHTGIGSDVLKQMLPVVATMVMGSLSRKTNESGLRQAASQGQSQGLLGMLTPMLDQDGDGSIADDVMGMMGRFLKR